MSDPLIHIIEDKCLGCNKCILNCPAQNANVAYKIDGQNKIKIDGSKCIQCGQCIKICDHDARTYIDSTQDFFEDLKNGKKISIIAAPSIKYNIEKYKKLFGYLKSLGVGFICDVSFGADITTWAYLKHIKENNCDTLISQPCPAIVNYIEKYKTELISKLAPIQSPSVCTAIYLKKYLNITDKIAFLSPCVAKHYEIKDPNTKNLIHYNVTFKKLLKYIEDNDINLEEYNEAGFNNDICQEGFCYSRPGGLSENIKKYFSDAWIRELSGHEFVYKYIEEYHKRLDNKKQVPLILDLLNCFNGCNLGTGTDKQISIDEIDYKINQMKKNLLLNKNNRDIIECCDQNLNFEDFKREYTNKSDLIIKVKEPCAQDYEEIYHNLHKTSEDSKHINCYSCGYGSCEGLAKAIYNRINILSSCIYYNRKELEIENMKEEFISMVSHELRTPLTSINGAISLLANNIIQKDEEQQRKLFKIAITNSERLSRLINDILYMEKIAAGKMEFSFEPIDINIAINESVESNLLYAKKYNIDLQIKSTVKNALVNVDKSRLLQVFTNLISNAVKFSETGKPVELASKRKRGFVRVKITDYGPGIPDDLKERLFNRFARTYNQVSRQTEGTGLGLSISKAIVERLGGRIGFYSGKNTGTTFYFDLPEYFG